MLGTFLKALAGFGGRGYRGGVLQGLAGFGVAAGANKVFDEIKKTPWYEERAPVTRMGLNIASFGATMSGYRMLARGTAGSLAAGADRAALSKMGGKPITGFRRMEVNAGVASPQLMRADRMGSNIDRAHSMIDKFLGPIYQQGSLFNRAAGLGGRGARGAGAFLAKMPFRMATGAVDVLANTPRTMAFMFGRSNASVASLMAPRSLFARMPGLNRVLDPSGTAAMGSGMFALTAALSGGGQAMANQHDRQSIWHGNPNSFSPDNYGQGFFAMRRGPAGNSYAPALTLDLHRNNRRNMP